MPTPSPPFNPKEGSNCGDRFPRCFFKSKDFDALILAARAGPASARRGNELEKRILSPSEVQTSRARTMVNLGLVGHAHASCHVFIKIDGHVYNIVPRWTSYARRGDEIYGTRPYGT